MTTKRTKKRTPKPPEPRGRRGHKAVDDDPKLRAWLVDALQRRPAPTLDELVEEARATGYAVGRTAIWEFRLAYEAERARKDLVFDLAERYNGTSTDGSVLQIETAIATLASARIFQTLFENEKLDDKQKDLLELFRKLQTSSSNRERTRFAVERGVRATTRRIRAEMQALLKKDPDTLRKVLTAIDQAAAEVRE